MSEIDPKRWVNDDTAVVELDDPGLVYAELRCGPWGIQYRKGIDDGKYEHLHARPAQFKVRGPFLTDRNIALGSDGASEVVDALDDCGGWDYAELGWDNE